MLGKTPPDYVRFEMDKYLKSKKVKVKQKEHKSFNEFLTLLNNEMIKDDFIDISTGKYRRRKTLKKLEKIYNEYKLYDGIIPFEILFKKNSEWYEYFKENCDKRGIPNERENRKGANKNYVNDIHKIMKKTNCNLEQAIQLNTIFIIHTKYIKSGFIPEFLVNKN